MAKVFQNTLTFNHYIINYGRICFLELDNAVTMLQKKPFSSFLDTKQKDAMEISNHHDEQLTPSESWDQDGFFSLGLGYHQIQILELEFLQSCGTQIRVNTWTGSHVGTLSRVYLIIYFIV